MPELSMFWDQLIQLIEEGKVVPVVGQDLLTIPESTVHTLLYPFLAERLARYLRVRADDLPKGAEKQRTDSTVPGTPLYVDTEFTPNPSPHDHQLQNAHDRRLRATIRWNRPWSPPLRPRHST